jgi:hypothetical protein
VLPFDNFKDSLDLKDKGSSRFIQGASQPESELGIKRPGILFGATLRVPHTDGFQIKLSIPSLPKLDLNLSGEDIKE